MEWFQQHRVYSFILIKCIIRQIGSMRINKCSKVTPYLNESVIGVNEIEASYYSYSLMVRLVSPYLYKIISFNSRLKY